MAREVDASNLMPVSRERSPHGHVEQADLRRQIQEALAELPATLREAVVKRDLQEFSYQEIAEQRFVSPLTIRKQTELLIRKLGLQSREELISWAVERGYSKLEIDP